ncbi:hypothetical protein DICSQDRAFT_155967 [Dichomitus squalens LYAD-421 SS1]|uniref:Uncharacterized protein n=1 Tax=Dichomitus squalens (strain LYAD-421) TaxID=732165 RepID=R7SVN6_DICSQ|nr:uncharacterized protein DICSQDRAFT_155967 [Dichomitus squalens LYAD-421 SS1]EJF59993.1 hypothetical protein DICSQDRAFT_155967 [Dichomitus squalens LYAD-421 SS1]
MPHGARHLPPRWHGQARGHLPPLTSAAPQALCRLPQHFPVRPNLVRSATVSEDACVQSPIRIQRRPNKNAGTQSQQLRRPPTDVPRLCGLDVCVPRFPSGSWHALLLLLLLSSDRENHDRGERQQQVRWRGFQRHDAGRLPSFARTHIRNHSGNANVTVRERAAGRRGARLSDRAGRQTSLHRRRARRSDSRPTADGGVHDQPGVEGLEAALASTVDKLMRGARCAAGDGRYQEERDRQSGA